MEAIFVGSSDVQHIKSPVAERTAGPEIRVDHPRASAQVPGSGGHAQPQGLACAAPLFFYSGRQE